MRRGRMLSLCLVLALCLALLPTPAWADAPSGQLIYVGGKNVTSGGYWTTDSEGKVTSAGATQPSNNYIHYDAGNNTLTLHNATIKEEVPLNTSTYVAGAAIGVHNQNGAAELTITLEGTNTIAEVGKGIYVLASSTGEATLTITSESGGSLDASGSSNPGIWVQSNNGDAALFIQNAKVEATGTSYGVNVQSHESSTASLTVDGGSLTASGSPGILYDSSGSGTVPNTTTLTISNSAIVDARGGGIGAGLLQDLKKVSPADDSVGIVFDNGTGTVYGDATLQEDLTVGDGQSLTLDDDATLDANDYNVIVDGGELLGGLETTLGDSVKYPPTITTTGTSLTDGRVGVAYPNTSLAADGDQPITWSWAAAEGSSLPDGLTLNTDTGEISGTPTAANTYTFTVKATNTYGSDSKQFTLTVNAAANVPVESVSLNKSETTLTVGGTETLTATVLPEGATNKSVTWSSNAPSVATVDENGVVTAVGSGTAIITVTTVDGNYTAVCTVSVTHYIPPVPSYLIQLPEVEGGTVTADRAAARQGTEVTLTVTPDEGFALASLTVTDFFGNQVDISRNSDGTYSFVMPASQVTVSAAFVPAQLPFTDVTEANWYYDEVYYVWANGLMQGTSAATFGPNVDTTRAMVVTILWRLEGEPASGYDMDYSDVAGGAWYADAVRWATEHGIVNGSEGQFYPGGIVTRKQLAAMLYRYAQYKGYDLTGGDLSGFADAGAVSGWAETSLAWAVGQRLIQGSSGLVDPSGSAIRAQTAAILMRFMENVAN